MDALSLTELRQRLFQLADAVIDTGEAVLIERRGVRLKLVRDEAERGGRLAKLKAQALVIGASLKPDESPAQWSQLPALLPSGVAEKSPAFGKTGKAGREKSSRDPIAKTTPTSPARGKSAAGRKR